MEEETKEVVPDDSAEEREIKVGNSVYRGKDWEEVANKVAAAQESAAAAIQDRERQIYELRQAEAARQVPQRPADERAFDANAFYEKIGKDPAEAIADAIDHYNKKRYGDIDPVEAVKYAYGVTRQTVDERSVAQFHANCPDFPQEPAAAQALLTRLNREGLPITATTLEAGFRQLAREGVIRPAVVEEETHRSRGASAPPSTRQRSTITEDQISSFEDLSLPEMEKELRKRGMRW